MFFFLIVAVNHLSEEPGAENKPFTHLGRAVPILTSQMVSFSEHLLAPDDEPGILDISVHTRLFLQSHGSVSLANACHSCSTCDKPLQLTTVGSHVNEMRPPASL